MSRSCWVGMQRKLGHRLGMSPEADVVYVKKAIAMSSPDFCRSEIPESLPPLGAWLRQSTTECPYTQTHLPEGPCSRGRVNESGSLPPAVFRYHPLVSALNIILTVKEKCLKCLKSPGHFNREGSEG